MDNNKRHLPVILLALFLICVLVFAVWGLNTLGLVSLPFIPSDTEETPDNGKEIEEILNSLSNSKRNGESVYTMLDSSVVKDVLATGKASNNYLHEYSLSYGEGGGAVEYSVLRRGADFHLLEFKDGKMLREVLCVGGTSTVYDARLGKKSTITGVGTEYFEQNSSSISAIDIINFVINFRVGTPVSWKLGTVLDCTVEAVREESVNMARITLKYSDHTDIYMLDIDRSALYSYESFVGETRTVSMRTTKISYDIEGLELDSVLD